MEKKEESKWRLEDAERQRGVALSVERISIDKPMLPILVFADAFIVSSQATEGLKAPGYSYSRLPDVLRSQFIAQSV